MRLSELIELAQPRLPAQDAQRNGRRAPRRKVSGAGIMAWVEQDGKCRSSRVRFEDASELGAGLRVAKAVPVGRTVWLLLQGGADYRAVTRHCAEEKGGFRVGIRMIPEKRGTSLVLPDPAKGCAMKWFDDWDNLRSSVVVVRRNGKAGVSVTVENPVPCPAIVLLATDEDLCLGCSRSCQEGSPCILTIDLLRETYVSY